MARPTASTRVSTACSLSSATCSKLRSRRPERLLSMPWPSSALRWPTSSEHVLVSSLSQIWHWSTSYSRLCLSGCLVVHLLGRRVMACRLISIDLEIVLLPRNLQCFNLECQIPLHWHSIFNVSFFDRLRAQGVTTSCVLLATSHTHFFHNQRKTLALEAFPSTHSFAAIRWLGFVFILNH